MVCLQKRHLYWQFCLQCIWQNVLHLFQTSAHIQNNTTRKNCTTTFRKSALRAPVKLDISIVGQTSRVLSDYTSWSVRVLCQESVSNDVQAAHQSTECPVAVWCTLLATTVTAAAATAWPRLWATATSTVFLHTDVRCLALHITFTSTMLANFYQLQCYFSHSAHFVTTVGVVNITSMHLTPVLHSCETGLSRV